MRDADATPRPTSDRGTSRRSYLFGAGTVLGSLGILGTTGRSAAAGNYERIVVGAGETFTKTVGTGETWENVLIDISASGATYQIEATGTDWTVRNVGITGHQEGGHTEPFRARVTEPNGTGTIENVYLAPTVADGNATGLYVYWDHAGHLDVNRLNVQNWTDNGVYASGPGNPDAHPLPGASGTVSIRNAYSKNNDKSNFRLGTNGSSLVNCCAAGGSSRGLWQFYESAEIVDCDLGGHTSDLALGDAVWEKTDRASLALSDSRWESEHAHGGASTEHIGDTPAGTPRLDVPDGCPTTAEEAASGTSGAGQPEWRLLEMTGQFAYRVEVTGEIRPTGGRGLELAEGEAYGDGWAESRLSGSDETPTVWVYTGDITSFETGDYAGSRDIRTLAVDGRSVEPSKL